MIPQMGDKRKADIGRAVKRGIIFKNILILWWAIILMVYLRLQLKENKIKTFFTKCYNLIPWKEIDFESWKKA